MESLDLTRAVSSGGEREGVIWTLEREADLNVNLVRFGTGEGVGEHVNDEVDVLIVSVEGSGVVAVDGKEHVLSAGHLVFVPKGSRRSTRALSGSFAYLTIHRRRGPLQIGGRS